MSAASAAGAAGAAGDGPIIDVHVHTELTGERHEASRAEDTPEALLAACRALGIVGAVTDSARPRPGVALPGVALRRCAVIDRVDFEVSAIERALAAGEVHAVKVNLGFVPLYADDERLRPVYELCARAEAPVLLHTGDPGWSYAKLRYAHPLTVDEVVVDHPRTTFVLVHAGNPWFETAAVIADKNPNAYLEASALLEGDLASLPPERVERHVVAPIGWLASYMTRPYKLMFGSGWPMVSLPAYVAAYRRALPRALWGPVLWETAARLFRIAV